MSKRKTVTAKRWTQEEINDLLNSGWKEMSSSKKRAYARKIKRTYMAVHCKLYDLENKKKPTATSDAIDLRKRTQTVTKSDYDKVMDTILDKATTAVIHKSSESITIYF